MEKKPVVKLRVYRGREVNYDANRKIKNENQLVSLEYNTKQWSLFMKNLPLNGYCKVEVEKVFKTIQTESKDKEGKKVIAKSYEPIEDIAIYDKEVQEAFNPVVEVAKTPEQKQIAELSAKVEAMTNGKKETKPKKEKKDKQPKNDNIKALRAEYKELYDGKNAFNGWGADKLKELIAEKKK